MRLVLVAALTLLSACALPRSGPTKGEIYAGSVERGGNANVVYVNDQVTRAANFVPTYGFSSGFRNAGQVGADEVASALAQLGRHGLGGLSVFGVMHDNVGLDLAEKIIDEAMVGQIAHLHADRRTGTGRVPAL
ncbi:MAG: polysaccharide export protein, partial [Paracoccus sp. (in: a-proteobacteria)]